MGEFDTAQQPSLAQLMMLPGANTPGASPLPAASPVQPQPSGGPIDFAALFSQAQQLPQMAVLNKLQGQEQDINAQQQANKPPSTIYQPKYQPITGHGFLGGLGSLLGDVGKGALEGLSATGIGQSMYGRPRQRQYEMKRQNLADQLASIKSQEEVPTEQLRAQTGLAGAEAMAAYRSGELENQRRKIDSYTQSVQNRLTMGLKSLDIKSLLAGSQVELNKAKQVLDTVLAQVAPERIQLGYYTTDADNFTRQSVANTLAQFGMDKTHPVAQLIDSWLGTSLTPAAPQSPGGAQPVTGNNPPPPRGGTTTPPKPPKPNAKPTGKVRHLGKL